MSLIHFLNITYYKFSFTHFRFRGTTVVQIERKTKRKYLFLYALTLKGLWYDTATPLV